MKTQWKNCFGSEDFKFAMNYSAIQPGSCPTKVAMKWQHFCFVPLLIIMISVAPAAAAQTIKINLDVEYQTIESSGINLEGFHRRGGDNVLPSKFEVMLDDLADDLVRVGMPLSEWEPENDDEQANHFKWNGFRDTGAVSNSFLRLQTLQDRGSQLWLAVWDVADWLVKNPDKDAQRRINDLDEFAEAITAYLIRARDHYNVKPTYISINEPSIASENGWGGYQLALTAEEQAALIHKAGERFNEQGLATKWLIAVHKTYPSELAYAKRVLNAPQVKNYVGGFDFHGYWFQSGHDAELEAWGKWVSSTGLPAFCGECDYDNQFWKRDDRTEWSHTIESGKLLHKIYSLAHAAGTLVWYDDAPSERRPYRFAARHFYDQLTPGSVLVQAKSSSPNVLAIAAKGPAENRLAIILQNISDVEVMVRIEGIPDVPVKWIRSSSASFYQLQPVQKGKKMNVALDPHSINSFYIE
ncbi:hypothetical protein GF373_15405 [bacterium]|nr:hypothetical protein [bacterium]